MEGFERAPAAIRVPGAVILALSKGISRASDALVIVVSEEKGWISMVLKDRLYPNLGTFALLEKLGDAREKSQKE